MRQIDDRVAKVKVVDVQEDPASGGNKIFVTLELSMEHKDGRLNDLEQFFHLDDVKRMALKAASAAVHRSTGWSDISPLKFIKDGAVSPHWDGADSVQVRYTCRATL
jgi:hypothetical protein